MASTISATGTLTASSVKNAGSLPFDPSYNDGAWTIKGFTAQNMIYPNPAATTPAVAVPTAHIVGNFAGTDGNAANGVVICTPSERNFVYNDTFYELDPVKVLIKQGTVAFDIPAGSWSWTFRVRIGPSTMTTTSIPVNSGSTVDLTVLTFTPTDRV